MLTDFDVVVFDAAERISVVLSFVVDASGRRPRGRRDLQYKPLASVVPGDHPLRMPPRRAAFLRAPRDLGRVVKLIIPDHIEMRAVIDLIEGSAEWIDRRIADAALAILKRLARAGKSILLAESSGIGLHSAAKFAN